MPVFTTIEDLRVLAQKRVPRMFYDYADSGSWTESTYRANERRFSDHQAAPAGGRQHGKPQHRQHHGRPGGRHAGGHCPHRPDRHATCRWRDIGCQRGTQRNSALPFTLSTMSICSIEDVAQETGGHPFWFQLYVMKDRDFIERLIDRAKAARCRALVLTLDLQILGQRHKDLKNGLSAPPKPTLANIINLATKVRWGWACWAHQRRALATSSATSRGWTTWATWVPGRLSSLTRP
jgi:L-lactate dehydrogenase (cytochrome)